MLRLTFALLTGTALLGSGVFAAVDQIVRTCGTLANVNVGNCPSNKPCCSAYGQCGIGAYCLGGCDPKGSFKMESCVPAPVCQDRKMVFTDSKLPTIQDKTQFLGDASKADWVSDGDVLFFQDSVLMTMAPNTAGSVLASTTYVWYGKVKAKLKTSRTQGVVTAFIFMSDVKDEIDFEWVGTELDQVQTNYYWQGVPDYSHSGKTRVNGSDTFSTFHTYEVDWTPDSITWTVDGNDIRKTFRKDTWNSTSKSYDYPQSPSRIQLSIWPGGLASNGKGTIDWAGGEIDWENSDDIKNSGYYYATVESVEITCYNPPSGTKKTGDKSYIFDNLAAMQENVVISNKGTILKSLLGSGTDMDKQLPSAVKSGSTPSSTDEVETVPGLSGAGYSGDSLRSGDGSTTSNNGDSGSSTDTGSGSSSTSWSQGGGNSDKNDAPGASGERALRGSFVAVAIALLGVALM